MNEMNVTENFASFPIGMAYVPMQVLTKVYEDPKEGFLKGSLFPDLYKPFEGRRAGRNE